MEKRKKEVSEEEKEKEREKEISEKEEKEKEVEGIINGNKIQELSEDLKKESDAGEEYGSEEETEEPAVEINEPPKPEEESKGKSKEENKEKPDSSEKDTKKLVILIVSLFAVIILIILGLRYFYANYSTPEYPAYTYNNFNFVKIAGLWHTQWQQDDKLYNVHLRYGPKESEDIPYYAESASFEPTGTLYLTFDPGENLKYVALASTELSLSLANTFNITPIAACAINDSAACSSRPIITCNNTNDAVIYIQQAEYPSITTKENCLIIQGNGEDLVRAADKVLWIWYGIIT